MAPATSSIMPFPGHPYHRGTLGFRHDLDPRLGAKADAATLADLEKDLKPLLDRKGQASALARELIALKSLAEGNIERARADLEALSLDLEAPQGVQARVQQALSTLPARTVNLDAIPKPAPAAPAAAPALAPTQPTQAPQ